VALSQAFASAYKAALSLSKRQLVLVERHGGYQVSYGVNRVFLKGVEHGDATRSNCVSGCMPRMFSIVRLMFSREVVWIALPWPGPGAAVYGYANDRLTVAIHVIHAIWESSSSTNRRMRPYPAVADASTIRPSARSLSPDSWWKCWPFTSAVWSSEATESSDWNLTAHPALEFGIQ